MTLYGMSDKYWYDGYDGMPVGEDAGGADAGGADGEEYVDAGVVSAGEGSDTELPGVGVVPVGMGMDMDDSPTTSWARAAPARARPPTKKLTSMSNGERRSRENERELFSKEKKAIYA